ncbi:MAG: HlyD family efflux transporter periplasmic adaptor subunit [Bacteroidetes bacterium]|nr:MAG: HlyD family efflux transporter periplasmic adaptor subunit [Bacteroidota bacterium]
MDRNLPAEVLIKRKTKFISGLILTAGLLVALTILLRNLTVESVHVNSVMIAKVDEGEMLITFTAAGKVVPLYEEAVISPVSSRILRILHQPGQWVEKGSKLLEIDIDSQQFEYERLKTEYEQTRNQHQRLEIDILKKEAQAWHNHQLLVKKIETLRIEHEHEQYLLSIGGISMDRVNKLTTELSTAKLELENSNQQLAYSKKITVLELESLKLNLNIHGNRLKEMEMLLTRARLEAPLSGTVSFLLNQPGASVAPGEVVARISDLSSYQVEAVVGDSYANQLLVGQEVLVRTGRDELKGQVAHIAPSVQEGVLNFGILLQDASHPKLRPNMKVEIRVVVTHIENAERIRIGEFYKGPGQYDLFVVNGNTAQKRKVRLGGASFSHIEVISGLNPNERVITSNMNSYSQTDKIGVKGNRDRVTGE